MARTKQACKNHPERLTSRRCYYCKEPICGECQHRLGNHLFCSTSCYYKWRWATFVEKINPKRYIPAAIGVLLFLILLGIYWSLRNEVIEIREQLAKQTSHTSNNGATDTSLIPVDTVSTGLINEMKITLRIPPGTAILLERDGKFKRTEIGNGNKITLNSIYLNHGLNKFKVWLVKPGGHMQLIDSLGIQFNSARIERLSMPLSSVPSARNKIALTFDGGSSNKKTELLLNVLRDENVRATMFLTGSFMRHFPELVQRIVGDGHQVANHSFTHPHLTTYEQNGRQDTRTEVTRTFVYRQLLSTDSLFFSLTGKHLSPFWRAPFGEYNREILGWAAEAGFRHVGWSDHLDTWDWVADTTSSLYRSPQEILNYLLKYEEKHRLDGKIILMHLSSERKKDFPFQILRELIQRLRAKGYRFVTINGLLRKPVSFVSYRDTKR